MTRLTAPLAALALLAAASVPAVACPYGKAETTASGPTMPITTAQGPMTPVPTTTAQ
ncbi:hypothetical protein RUR49_16865 [Pseudoxanthobacter sp. M-2]|uniref:hypothetical protein n=1 Tax=Pseudoxanthobacter sp. M-2 TaxID=3078754 RepID=UPI0038FC076B